MLVRHGRATVTCPVASAYSSSKLINTVSSDYSVCEHVSNQIYFHSSALAHAAIVRGSVERRRNTLYRNPSMYCAKKQLHLHYSVWVMTRNKRPIIIIATEVL